MNTKLLPRPFSSDRPRVEGYEPLITGEVIRIGRRRRNSWRAEVLVDSCVMTLSHHDTKSDAETYAERMIGAYAKVHYVQV
jgi:hypothetical protein